MVVVAIAVCTAGVNAEEAVVYRSESFTITPDSVIQGPFVARAVDRDTIVSSYPRAADEVMFKFSINGTENEFAPGTDHRIYLRPAEGKIVTPIYRFGVIDEPEMPRPSVEMTSEEGSVDVTFRLDMRGVFESFRETGSYDPPNGPPIAADELEGIYIAGNMAPLTWEFHTFVPGSRYELTDPEGDGIYTVTLPFEARYNRPLHAEGQAGWKRTADLSGLPVYESSQPIVDAVYRLSLEELILLTGDDGGIVAGAKWPGVWTRDLAWGTILAFAPLVPEQVKTSLMLKVDDEGRIIQDTGTGGSWPISTDRVSWTVAAWELYKVTGDRDWLRSSFEIIRRSAEADLHAAFDETTGLFYGESSFLDWRDQSYPAWMDPKDIYLSQTLGTNALHYASWDALGKMARLLGEPAEHYETIARRIRQGMNTYLWQPDLGWYGQFRYGRNYPSLSPRAEALGEAFTILFGIADEERQERLAERNPVVEFGVPSFWPYIPEMSPYHNAGIWPQVNGFWTWAAAEAGNAKGADHGLASIVRASALFLTNKENMVAETGHFEGTELNSDRLVGSVGGALGVIHRVLLGLRFEPDALRFDPLIPPGWDGTRTLRGLRFRDSTLDITIEGFGDRVAETKLDGRVLGEPSIPSNLKGEHRVQIRMNDSVARSRIHLVENVDSPAVPRAVIERANHAIRWEPVDGAVSYAIHRNGERWRVTRETSIDAPAAGDELVEIQVLAEGENGHASFLSEPLRISQGSELIVEPRSGLERRYGGFEGDGYLHLSTKRNREVRLSVEVTRPGLYAIDVRYGNGSGPVNSSNKAAIRSLFVNDQAAGVLVMPQRGTDLWTDWGYSNPLRVQLAAGKQTLAIRYTDADRNMNGEINEALLDHARLTLLEADQ